MKTPFDNWEKNATIVDVEITRDIRIAQYPTPCPWCDKKYLVIVDRKTARVSGHRLCDNCGEFFRFDVYPQTGDVATKRSKGRIKRNRGVRNDGEVSRGSQGSG